MAKYVCLVKLRLESFAAWKLEYIPRGSNEKANALAAVAASLPTKETVLLPMLLTDGTEARCSMGDSGPNY